MVKRQDARLNTANGGKIISFRFELSVPDDFWRSLIQKSLELS